MRVLVVLPYGPSHTRVRSKMLLQELSGQHEIGVCALLWGDDDREALQAWADRGVPVRAIEHSRAAIARSALTHPGRPLQRMVSTSPALAAAARRELAVARDCGNPYDAVHVEHLRGAAAVDLLAGLETRTVLDAVDSIAELARLTRQHGPSLLARTLARVEEQPTRRYEARLVRAADVVTVVAERDRRALAGLAGDAAVEVVPNGVARLSSPVRLVDEPIVIFTGKLSYHANQAAAQRLVSGIWPRVRAEVPAARLIIAGAGAPAWLTRLHGAHGIEVHDSPSDLTALIAGARVAVAPVVYSVGIQNKVLEAMACGVPVVASPSATEGLLPAARGTLLEAGDDEMFARHVTGLLGDTPIAAALGRAGFSYVARHHSWPEVARVFGRLYSGATRLERAA